MPRPEYDTKGELLDYKKLKIATPDQACCRGWLQMTFWGRKLVLLVFMVMKSPLLHRRDYKLMQLVCYHYSFPKITKPNTWPYA